MALHTSSDKYPALNYVQVTDSMAVKYNSRKGWAAVRKIIAALGDNNISNSPRLFWVSFRWEPRRAKIALLSPMTANLLSSTNQ